LTVRSPAALARYLRSLMRPWKLVTFAIGTGFFVWGAYLWAVPTWDVGVAVLMSVLCYLLAPWAMDLVWRSPRERRPGWLRKLGLGALAVYLVASGSYEIYNTLRMGQHPVTYWENLAFSVPVTIAAGLLWRYDGSLRDLLRELRPRR
jgi:hypothetical protein